MTIAQNNLAAIKERPHASTQREMLTYLRTLPGARDEGYRETFTFSDGSVLTYDHTANPGYEWRLD